MFWIRGTVLPYTKYMDTNYSSTGYRGVVLDRYQSKDYLVEHITRNSYIAHFEVVWQRDVSQPVGISKVDYKTWITQGGLRFKEDEIVAYTEIPKYDFKSNK